MKKFLIVIAMCSGISAFSQNLQFSQVLTLTYTSTQTMYSSMQVFATVPQGKVWKIESFLCSSAWSINDFNVGSNTSLAASSIWLKSGDVIKRANTASLFLSVVEYTIVP